MLLGKSVTEATNMPVPRMSVRSARVRELAHSLAMRERCSVAEVVERALEAYSAQRSGRAPAAEFYRELNRQYATDVDLEELIQASRSSRAGVVL